MPFSVVAASLGPSPWCLGGAAWDRKLRLLSAPLAGSSNPVTESCHPGGVARNIAHTLRLLGFPVTLLSAWGDDSAGQTLATDCNRLGIDIHAVRTIPGCISGAYTAVLETDGNLHLGLAQMEALEHLGPETLRDTQALRAEAPLQIADLNLRQDTLTAWLGEPRQGLALLQGISEAKMARLPEDLSRLDALIVNAGEWWAGGGNTEMARRGLKRALVTQGAQGVRLGQWVEGQWSWTTLPAIPLDRAVDVTGAGDAFAAGVVAALLYRPENWRGAAQFGQHLSHLCLQSSTSVATRIQPGLLALFLQICSAYDN
ncbi:PfkB family carbohydrate kinase [Inhella gelatinilytica]|uniref:Pseudouridine-5-phosphate glycosidase n=1 Tax=Inhella gelatinilytica TaxID=2795030 RepID=A0A931NED6_9BURK|nr:PfkB family carbohydrate kinase [Inhella gelatinilytica]MBH9553564.1 pseudouridine-5-phosphate glycosidase [Inhella gelatinilytica]